MRRPPVSSPENSIRCGLGVHPCIDACSRRQRYRSILADARRQLRPGGPPSTAGLRSRRSHAFGLLIKGRNDIIVRDGALDEAAARRNRLSEHDVLEDLRLNGNVAEM